MTKNLERVMEKMCQMVGADFSKMDFKKTNWFHDYSWTEEQENKFAHWMTGLLVGNEEVRREFMKFPSSREENIKKFIGQFLMNYGWKTKNNHDS